MPATKRIIPALHIAGARLGANRRGQCRFSTTTGEPFGPLQLSCAYLDRCNGMEAVALHLHAADATAPKFLESNTAT